jgi:hypothetical protein
VEVEADQQGQQEYAQAAQYATGGPGDRQQAPHAAGRPARRIGIAFA